MKNKVILLGVDGASWNIIRSLIDNGKLPTLREICRDGTIATLSSTVPPMSLPAWNSIFTGTNPGKHGVADSVVRINDQIVPVTNSKFRTMPTMWEYLSNNETNCIIVNDPVSYPPLKIKGIHMTGFLTPSNSNQFIHPIELKESIKCVKHYVPEVLEDYYSMLRKNLCGALETALIVSRTQEDAAVSLLRNFSWRMFNFTITLTDRVFHFMWHKKRLLSRVYEHVDAFLDRLLNSCSSENVDLLIVSDHGFERLDHFFFINNWLIDNGFSSKESRRVIQRFQSHILKHLIQIPTPVTSLANKFQISKRQPKFFSDDMALAFGTGSIFLNYSHVDQANIKIMNVLLQKLKNLKHKDKLVLGKVIRKEDVLNGPYIHRAGDILLSFAGNYDIHTGILGLNWFGNSRYVFEQMRRTGKHSKSGIFVGYGPNIMKNKQVQYLLKTWDIAPTLLHMLGLPIPQYMDGKVLKEIFRKNSFLTKRRVRIRPWTEKERIKERIRMIKDKL